ncbi:hypothetical protein [Microscilla marina]|uniref:Tetratricopeptide repeat domain protein n=1 Tax=Microscilla marina ATCC 23134 TaxID=313606 RepID=A1ZT99_MICM2|nr:hypothetical protein [Microscilla marina]EAY26321.1 hypothetical protein M23134_04599 [Microscilla marina ATCC 23134]
MIKKLFFILLLLLGAGSVQAQNLLADKAQQQTMLKALQRIYNWEFAQANQTIASLPSSYSNHPSYYLLKALVLHWQYLPLEKNHPQFVTYEKLLNHCAKLSEARLKANKKDVEGVFFKLMAYGLKALAEVETGSLRSAVSHGRRAYRAIKQGFKKTDDFSEFHFSTGLYRYYAKQFPQSRPIIKPFMVFFPSGDKNKGLAHLRTATQKALFTRQESWVFLGDIYLKYEANIYQASLAFAHLTNTFPKNPFFALKYAECLVHLERYYEAQNYFARFKLQSLPIYQVGSLTLEGMIAEKLQKNDKQAQMLYQQAIHIKGFDQRYSRDYRALAKAGLARIAAKKTDKKSQKMAKELYKQARKHTEYEWLKKVIKKALKAL